MPQSHSADAFPDCRNFLDRAVESKKGARAIFPTKKQALSFRMRCYTARARERKRNCQIYEKGDMLFDTSVWHRLTFIVRELSDGRGELIATHDGDEALRAAGVHIEEIE